MSETVSAPTNVPAPRQPAPVAPAFAHLPSASQPAASGGSVIASAFETYKAARDAAASGTAAGTPATPPSEQASPSGDAPATASTPDREGAGSPTAAAPVDVLTPGDGAPVAQPPADAAAPAVDDEPVVDEEQPIEAGAEGEGATDELDPNDPLYVELAAATPNGEPLKLLAPDEETKAAITRLQNGYARGEQVKAMQEAKDATDAEAAEWETKLRTDPIGVVMDAMTTEQGIALARQLISLEPVLRALEADGVSVDDPQALERMALRAAAAREKSRSEAERSLSVEREVRQNARDLHAMLGRLIPPNLTPEQERLFLADARHDLVQYQQQQRVRTIPPQHVPQILAARLAVYGVNAAERLRRAPATPRKASPPVPAATGVPAGAGTRKPVARTFARVQATQAAKQLAAATAPGTSGHGAPGGRLAGHVQPGATIQQAIQQARELMRAQG